MEYEIYCDGKLIAQFENESDRDVCLVAFEDYYFDAEFTTD